MPGYTTDDINTIVNAGDNMTKICAALPNDTDPAVTASCKTLEDELNRKIDEPSKWQNLLDNTVKKESEFKFNNSKNLQDKKTLTKIISEKSENLKQHIDNIKQERMNKQRLVEASEWEYDRYNSHIYIFKFIFFSLVIINIILFIRKKVKMIPDSIYFGVIVLITAFMLYNVISEIATNLRRDKFDYDKLEQVYDSRFDGDDGVTIDKNKSKSGGIIHNLMCESFKNRKEDTLNRHNYSFIH